LITIVKFDLRLLQSWMLHTHDVHRKIEDPNAKSTQFIYLAQCYLTVIIVFLDLLNLLYKFEGEKRQPNLKIEM
jgi:hypothetical protein